MPTFLSFVKEVGIVPIFTICFIVNRYKEGKTEDFGLKMKRFSWCLGVPPLF
jgi:hypothetical protein